MVGGNILFSASDFWQEIDNEIKTSLNYLESCDAVNNAFERFQTILKEHTQTRDGIERYQRSKAIGFVMKLGEKPAECSFIKLIFLDDMPDEIEEMNVYQDWMSPIHREIITQMRACGWTIFRYDDGQIGIIAEKT